MAFGHILAYYDVFSKFVKLTDFHRCHKIVKKTFGKAFVGYPNTMLKIENSILTGF